MLIYTYSEARQKFSKILDEAEQNGKGQNYSVKLT